MQFAWLAFALAARHILRPPTPIAHPLGPFGGFSRRRVRRWSASLGDGGLGALLFVEQGFPVGRDASLRSRHRLIERMRQRREQPGTREAGIGWLSGVYHASFQRAGVVTRGAVA